MDLQEYRRNYCLFDPREYGRIFAFVDFGNVRHWAKSFWSEEGKFLGRIRKCNFDIEITMDMLTKIETYDTVFLWSGDSDFHLLLEYLKSKKKKIITICCRNFASEELRLCSNLFIPADPLKDLLEYIPINKSTPDLRQEA